jgi:hypothetical protein
MVRSLKSLDLSYPQVSDEQRAGLKEMRKLLENE